MEFENFLNLSDEVISLAKEIFTYYREKTGKRELKNHFYLCLYIACRSLSCSNSLRSFEKAYNIKITSTIINKIKQAINDKYVLSSKYNIFAHFELIAKEYNLSEDEFLTGKIIISKIRGPAFSPSPILASTLYFLIKERSKAKLINTNEENSKAKLTQEEVCESFNISEQILRRRLREIEKLDLDL